MEATIKKEKSKKGRRIFKAVVLAVGSILLAQKL